MTTKQLSFKGPPSLAIAAGATTPDPGINGVQVWSTTENALVFWGSNSWELSGGGGAPATDSLFNPIHFDPAYGAVAVAAGTDSFSVHGGACYVSGTQGTVTPTSGPTRFDTLQKTSITTTAATYVAGILWSAANAFTRGTSARGGVVFDALFKFTPQSNGIMFAGLADKSQGILYSDGVSNTIAGLGICGYGADNLNQTLRLYFGNGTTTTTSAVYTRAAGTRNAPIYHVYIRVPAGSTTAKIWVVDYGVAEYPDGYTLVDGVSVDISTLSASLLMDCSVGYGTGSTSVARVVEVAFFRARHWATDEVYQEAAVNITGNAATADKLLTSKNIQGVPFDGSTNIDVISIGTTAPASPVLNQLWIQT